MKQTYTLTFHNAKGERVGDPIVKTTGYLAFHDPINAVCDAFSEIVSWTVKGEPIRPEEPKS